jgi:hypothetical protein
VVMGALRQHLSLHGARVSDNLHHGVTHIVMRPEQLGRACKIRVSHSRPSGWLPSVSLSQLGGTGVYS